MDVIDKNITYESLIDSAASSLHSFLSNSSVSIGQFRESSAQFTIGGGVKGYLTDSKGYVVYNNDQGKSVSIKEIETRDSSYSTPSKDRIVADLRKFLSSLQIPIKDSIPTQNGLLAFLFALNFFMEKAVIKRVIQAENKVNPIYHFHYETPTITNFTSLPVSYDNEAFISIDNIVISMLVFVQHLFYLIQQEQLQSHLVPILHLVVHQVVHLAVPLQLL